MIKFCVIASFLLATVVCTTAGSDLRITTPFDLVRDSAYSQVIEELEDIMETINSTGDSRVPGAGTAVTAIFKVAKFFIDKNKADAKKQELINLIERQVEMVMEALGEIKRMVRLLFLSVQPNIM